jgi:hypothetical protein
MHQRATGRADTSQVAGSRGNDDIFREAARWLLRYFAFHAKALAWRAELLRLSSRFQIFSKVHPPELGMACAGRWFEARS